MPSLSSCFRRGTGGAVAGRCWLIDPYQRGQRGCRQGRAALHSDPDAGRSCSASPGFLHVIPPQKEQAAAQRRSGHLQLPHCSGNSAESIEQLEWLFFFFTYSVLHIKTLTLMSIFSITMKSKTSKLLDLWHKKVCLCQRQ